MFTRATNWTNCAIYKAKAVIQWAPLPQTASAYFCRLWIWQNWVPFGDSVTMIFWYEIDHLVTRASRQRSSNGLRLFFLLFFLCHKFPTHAQYRCLQHVSFYSKWQKVIIQLRLKYGGTIHMQLSSGFDKKNRLWWIMRVGFDFPLRNYLFLFLYLSLYLVFWRWIGTLYKSFKIKEIIIDIIIIIILFIV